MAYRVMVSGPANADLDAAVGYIAVTLEAPSAAATLLDEFEEKLQLLADNPRLFGVDLYVSEAVNRQVRRCPYPLTYRTCGLTGCRVGMLLAHQRPEARTRRNGSAESDVALEQ